MTPTAEQHAIRAAAGRIARINARAGTGKTTTLKLVANAYPQERILYLVFNRHAREEAKRSFPKHVDAQTVHSLAFRAKGSRWRDTLGHFSPADMLFAFGAKEQLLATLSHDFLVYFLNSPYDVLEKALAPFTLFLSDQAKDLFVHEQRRILDACRVVATAWNTGQKPCPHDFYLKMSHKSGAFQAALNRYGMLLVDEAQDLSPIMLEALKQYRKRIFLVGDSHQQIYSFRYAIDAMRNIASDDTFELSQSFRFGSRIAELVSLFIQEAKREPQFRIDGSECVVSSISFAQTIQAASASETVAALSRTNVALFENAMELRSRKISFRFERDLYPLLLRTLDVYWLADARTQNIRDPLIRSFKNLDELERYAEDTENFQMQGMIEIVEKYAPDFPGVVFEFGEIAKKERNSGDAAGVILSTIHSAKGQEYDRVYLHADMAENLARLNNKEHAPDDDEINVAYVGLTRAKRQICLPPEFTDILTPRWTQYLTAHHGNNAAEQVETRPKLSRRKPAPTQPPPASSRIRAKLRPGDRVLTTLGLGTILEVSSEYCLVDLGAHQMKLRERIENLRRYK